MNSIYGVSCSGVHEIYLDSQQFYNAGLLEECTEFYDRSPAA
jgi:hypothetical protein